MYLSNSVNLKGEVGVNNIKKFIGFTKVDLPYGWLGNMSPFWIEHEGKRYRSTEALFQCLRFDGCPQAERELAVKEIMAEPSPMIAKNKAKSHRKKLGFNKADIGNEEDIARMKFCLKLKLQQHPHLVGKLLYTKDAFIVEDCTDRKKSSTGEIWGAKLVNNEWIGRNLLGNLWMELREELRMEAEKSVASN
jgi:predicted NAD-dependent protein-ADP-ribosyltransferase YbiA (DUF1768 family)